MSAVDIIVLAYGPRRVTTDGVERAKALARQGGRVLVVPAVRMAARPLGALRSPRVDIIEEVGRSGLASALDRTTSGQVLLVHDDVALTERSLARLCEVHTATGAVTVPWTNDREQSTFVGSLPPSRSAPRTLDDLAVRTSTSAVDRVRPVCLVATADQFRDLLPKRMTVARTLLLAGDGSVVAAEGALAAHDASCIEQLAPSNPPGARPLITAMLIVRDEESNIAACLASLDQLVDRIVVADTGSVDATREIVTKHGAELVDIEWRDDFAWARNQVLERCRDSSFVLQVDADERVVCDASEVRRHLATDVDDSVAFTVRIDNFGDDGRVATSHVATRLFRPSGVHYAGALHEQPVRADGIDLVTVRFEGLTLDHHGYRSEAFHGRGKSQRNVDIARKAYEASRGALEALHYARSLISATGDLTRAEELLDEALDLGLPTSAVAYALGRKAALCRQADDHAGALASASEALELVPADDEAAFEHARAALALDRPQLVVDRASARVTLPSPTPFNTSLAARTGECLTVARALVALGHLADAARTVEDAMGHAPPLDLDAWIDIVSILVLAAPDDARERLAVGVANDTTGNALRAAREVAGTTAAGEIAVMAARAGAPHPEVVKVGLAHSIITGDDDALAALVPHASALDAAVAERLMEVAAARGLTDVAGSIAKALLSAA